MALPTNSGLAKTRGCNPVSSNCVVWQGPDLDCINLCKGDTISEVIAKLAEELCAIVEQFDLGGYDFACLSVPPSEQPDDLQDLIQILIDRICLLEGITPATGTGDGSDCPDDCIVTIAPCFQFINPQGDTVTTMGLLEYVTAIGNQICTILSDILVLQTAVDSLELIVNGDNSGTPIANNGGIVGEIGDIQDTYTPKSSLQYVNSDKIDQSQESKFITGALRSVENSYITYIDSLGTSTQLYQSILAAGNINDGPRLNADGIMSSIPGWEPSVSVVADSLNNMWYAINDLRGAVAYMQENCCSTSCTDLYLNLQTTLDITISTTYLNVFTSGSTGFSSEWSECSAQGTNVIVTDSAGNTTTFRANLIELIDIPSGLQIDLTATPIDPTLDITITAETCFKNEAAGSTCEKDYINKIFASADCPSVILTVYTTSINYQFTTTSGLKYIVNVYIKDAPTPFASQIISQPAVTVLSSISGLTASTDYEYELVLVNGSGVETPCTKQDFTTLPNDCTPPINAVALLTIP